MTHIAPELVVDQLLEQRNVIQAVYEEIQAISVRATNLDRSVGVEVDGLGSLTELWLTASAYRHGPQALAAEILKTAHAAAKLATDRQALLATTLTEQLTALQQTPS